MTPIRVDTKSGVGYVEFLQFGDILALKSDPMAADQRRWMFVGPHPTAPMTLILMGCQTGYVTSWSTHTVSNSFCLWESAKVHLPELGS